MKKIINAIIILLIFTLIVDFFWLVEFVYPFGEFVHDLLGDFGTILGYVLGTIALFGNAIFISVAIYALSHEVLDRIIYGK